MFPPRLPRAVPLSALTPDQLEALHDLHRLRQEAEAEVERLIAFLDMVDGYPISEMEEDEADQSDDRLRCLLRRYGDNSELEPSLGSIENHPTPWISGRDGDQRRWASGATDDSEGDDGDLEPSLGWTADGQLAAQDSGFDLEQGEGPLPGVIADARARARLSRLPGILVDCRGRVVAVDRVTRDSQIS